MRSMFHHYRKQCHCYSSIGSIHWRPHPLLQHFFLPGHVKSAAHSSTHIRVFPSEEGHTPGLSNREQACTVQRTLPSLHKQRLQASLNDKPSGYEMPLCMHPVMKMLRQKLCFNDRRSFEVVGYLLDVFSSLHFVSTTNIFTLINVQLMKCSTCFLAYTFTAIKVSAHKLS